MSEIEILYKHINDLEKHFNDCIYQEKDNIFSMINDVCCKIEKVYTEIFDNNSSPDILKGITNHYRGKLHPFLLQSPFIRRCYKKDAGYAGDYEMMRMIHHNPGVGESEFGKKLNSYILGLAIPDAIRQRTRYLTDLIISHLSGGNSMECDVLSVACGPALEIEGVLEREPGLVGPLSLTLLDQDQKALDYARGNLTALMKKQDSPFSVRYLNSRIEKYIFTTRRNPQQEQFSVIYSSGLFDYFNYKTARFVISHLLSLLKPGGSLVIANVSHDGHDQRAFMELGMDWHLVYRNKEELLDLAEDIQGLSAVTVDEIAGGFVKFLILQR